MDATITGVDLERTCILDDYSAQLARRDKALDSRETLIDRREKELLISKQRVSEQVREVEHLKSSLYAERAGFVVQRSALANERKEIDGKAAVIRDLIKTSKNTSVQLSAKKHELKSVNENLAQMYAALKAAQESMDGLRRREQRTVERESKCTDIVIALDNRQKELDTLQNELHRLQNQLSKRENNVADAIQVIPLKDCLPELKQVARDYAEFRARRSDTDVDIDPNAAVADNAESGHDPKEHARKLNEFFNDIRTFARSLEAREAATIRREDALNLREASHSEAAALLSAREKEVALKTRELEAAQRKVDDESRTSREMWEKSEENLRKIATMEEDLDARERACRDEEVRLNDEAKNIERQKSLISAQEKSIKRTGASLKGFEEALRRDAQKVKEEKAEISRLEADIEGREKLLKTKTVEIEVREGRLKRVDIFNSSVGISDTTDATDSRPPAQHRRRRDKSRTREKESKTRRQGRKDNEGTRNSEGSSSGSGSGSNANNEQVGNDGENNDELPKTDIEIDVDDVGSTGGVRKAAISDTSDPAKSAQVPVQRTVRKQLTFGQTPNVNIRIPAAVESDNNASTNATSSSSEAAAEQLHGELRAARAVWIEKVNRLDSVVASMSQDLTSTGTQLLPVIRTVRSELNRIRDEASAQNDDDIDIANQQRGSSRFGEEQARHRHWAHVMTAQLNTIKQVQAGLLHAFNRVLPPPSEQHHSGPHPSQTPVYQSTPLPREPLQPRQTQPLQEGRGRRKKKNSGNRSNSRDSTNNSNSASASTEEHHTLEKLFKVIDASSKPYTNPNRSTNKPPVSQSNNNNNTTSISVYSNKAIPQQLPKYRMTAPLRGAWADIDRVASISRTPRTTNEELAALRKELGLDN